jgi:Fe(II)/alpha-ketoglutarate-dependent arginine beta-hydroxylase
MEAVEMKVDNAIEKFEFSSAEIRAIHNLVQEVTASHQTVESSSFLETVSMYAHELPRRVRSIITSMRLAEEPSVIVFSGYPIDDGKLGPTPGDLSDGKVSSRTLQEEVLLMLLASSFGDVIGWSTQQAGRIIHDVLPIKAHAQEQIGTGSEQTISWHTEDAFTELRGDYVGLMCLRNPDRVATTICPMSSIALEERQIRLLSAPSFTIRPDESHRQKNASHDGESEGAEAKYDKIDEMLRNPEKIAVLSGAADAPYVRIDPYFMDREGNTEAQLAMDALIKAIDERIQDVVLAPGDICFIDNYRTVHGRQPFKARYDGKDRWLKRINITRDLRKSRAHRKSALSRVIQ